MTFFIYKNNIKKGEKLTNEGEGHIFKLKGMLVLLNVSIDDYTGSRPVRVKNEYRTFLSIVD